MNKKCPYCKSSHVVRNGFFKRANAPRGIRRYRCRSCRKSFSSATGTEECWQKKRHINKDLAKLLSCGSCLSDCARVLNINPKTVSARLPYLAKKARRGNRRLLKKAWVKRITFDDVITKENSKCKPLTVPLAVCDETRLILDFQVGVIPAFGHLAKIAKKKYGKRKNEHVLVLEKMFRNLKAKYGYCDHFKSDNHKAYPLVLRAHFPRVLHESWEGGRGCIAGQGELKKKVFDPLFSLNHTAAMLRAKVSRLMRKSWNTTKKIECLVMHLEIYQYHHNASIMGTQSSGGVSTSCL